MESLWTLRSIRKTVDCVVHLEITGLDVMQNENKRTSARGKPVTLPDRGDHLLNETLTLIHVWNSFNFAIECDSPALPKNLTMAQSDHLLYPYTLEK